MQDQKIILLGLSTSPLVTCDDLRTSRSENPPDTSGERTNPQRQNSKRNGMMPSFLPRRMTSGFLQKSSTRV